MNLGVVFASKTGHTKEIAKRMARAWNTAAQSVEEAKSEKWDLLLLGTGIYAGKSHPLLLEWVENLKPEDIGQVIVFSTSLAQQKPEDLLQLLHKKGMTVHPQVFLCKGKFLFFNRKHPDDADLARAEQFARAFLTAAAE